MNLNLRAGRPDDAEICGRICFEAFKTISEKHNFPWDVPSPEAGIGLMNYILSRHDIYSVVGEIDGKVVGSNFLWEGNKVAGVGPITVDPNVQNSAIGRRLMEDLLRRVEKKGFLSVRLCQAAYHNRSLSLYTKLGFDTCEPLSTI
jgi:ribosomal protein S18 acetylase RimI-like enzyme